MSGLYISLFLMLTVFSQNVAGMRSQRKIEEFFLNIDYDIIILQETNWDGEILSKIERLWGGSIYVSNGVNKCCGVDILIKNSGLFKSITEIHKDDQGRQLILDLNYRKNVIRIINSYAPNIETERKRYFENIK